MLIQLVRLNDDGKSTIGTLSINGAFQCFTLEDTYNEPKVYGKTRVPAGEYRIKLRDAGGMNKKYASRFPNHKGMLWLQDVPGFEWVYIHLGNSHQDTDGCVLVGKGCDSRNNTISASKVAYIDLYGIILDDINKEIEVTIQII